LTLEVETPEGTKTGSGVIEHMARYNDGFFRGLGAGAGLAVGTRGEAVIVDLGARGLAAVPVDARYRLERGAQTNSCLPENISLRQMGRLAGRLLHLSWAP